MRLPPDRTLPLYGQRQTRTLEQAAMTTLPPHELMQHAAHAVARLARALYPHAHHIWIACGPGNNGGDGLLAAAELHTLSPDCNTRVSVTWTGTEARLPDDARFALDQARRAGVAFTPGPPQDADLVIDALLGIGAHTAVRGDLAPLLAFIQNTASPVLCVDLPSGLCADTGDWPQPCPARPRGPRHTLTLLTLKPGLFTASGRDAAGTVWLDDLDVTPTDREPDAELYAPLPASTSRRQRHAEHKGSHGDLVVIGGQHVSVNGHGMTGAALLAARAGLQGGAGRVFVGLLGDAGTQPFAVDPLWPDLMFRHADDLLSGLCHSATVVCGCGGGTAVQHALPPLLQSAPRLVLDADALNAIAQSAALQSELRARATRQQWTVLTPHPLEAARLLGRSSADIQQDRLRAARDLTEHLQCAVVLKGSGSIVTAPGQRASINPTGNALLASAGTGDVLAGLIGAGWSQRGSGNWKEVADLTRHAVWDHGHAADTWPHDRALTANALVSALRPLDAN